MTWAILFEVVGKLVIVVLYLLLPEPERRR